MSPSVQNLLDSFEHLSDSDKREMVREIIRRAAFIWQPQLSDEDLVLNAESVFLELDCNERNNVSFS